MILFITPEGAREARRVAELHDQGAVARGAVPKNGQDPSRCIPDLEIGYRAELALCEFLGVPWRSSTEDENWRARKAGDLIVNGRPIEVRSSQHKDARFLLGQPDDHDDRPYLLILPTCYDDIFEWRGWTWGQFMKADEYWADRAGDGRPCFWFPVSELYPPEELLAWIGPTRAPVGA